MHVPMTPGTIIVPLDLACAIIELFAYAGIVCTLAVRLPHHVVPTFRGSNLEGGLEGFENVVKRTSNGAYRSPRCPAVTKHPMTPGGSSIISL